MADYVKPAKMWRAYNAATGHCNPLTIFCILGLLLT